MRIMRRVAVAAGMVGLMTRIGAAQSLPSLPVPTAHHAASIETMYKQMGLVAHAAKGQTVDQQKIDGRECFNTAKSQTGFDPMTATSLNPTAVAAQAATVAGTKPTQQVNAFKKAAGGCLQSKGYTVKY